jgi:hypothetical protein
MQMLTMENPMQKLNKGGENMFFMFLKVYSIIILSIITFSCLFSKELVGKIVALLLVPIISLIIAI